MVNVPAEEKVVVKADHGKDYLVTLLDGKLDVRALKEQLDLEGLALTKLNGSIPMYDDNGMSRTVFSGNIKAKHH